MCRLFVLTFLGFVFCSAANSQERGRPGQAPGLIAKENVLEEEGVIVEVKHLRNGDIGLKYKPLDGEEKRVTLSWRTMIYMLTQKNTEGFAQADGRLDKVYQAITSYQGDATMRGIVFRRQQQGERLSGPQEAQLASYLEREAERHRIFGSPVKLAKGMGVYLYSDKDLGVGYAVLVKYTDKTTQSKEGKTKEKAREEKLEATDAPTRPKDIIALMDQQEKPPKPSTNPLVREQEEKIQREKWEAVTGEGRKFEGIATVRRIAQETKAEVVVTVDFPHANRDPVSIRAMAADAKAPALLQLEEGQLVVVTGTYGGKGKVNLTDCEFRVIGKQEDERLLKIREKNLRDLWAYPPR